MFILRFDMSTDSLISDLAMNTMRENNQQLYLSDDDSSVVFDHVSKMEISNSSSPAEFLTNKDNTEIENLKITNMLLLQQHHQLKTENIALKDRQVLLSTELQNMENDKYILWKIKEEDDGRLQQLSEQIDNFKIFVEGDDLCTV